jgi:hypothetical protein
MIKIRSKKRKKSWYDLDLAWLQVTGEERWIKSDSPTAQYYGYKPSLCLSYMKTIENSIKRQITKRGKI